MDELTAKFDLAVAKAYVLDPSISAYSAMENALRSAGVDEIGLKVIMLLAEEYQKETNKSASAEERANTAESYAEKMGAIVAKKTEQPTNQTNINAGGDVNQTGNTNVTDSEIAGNVGATVTMTNCFNKIQDTEHPEIKGALEELHQQVLHLMKHLPEGEKREQAARDYETLVTEATAEKPRRKWLELSAEGLKEAAIAVASMTPSVVSAVTNLLTLFPPS